MIRFTHNICRVETVPKGRRCYHCKRIIDAGESCIFVPGMGRYLGMSFHIMCYKKYFIDSIKDDPEIFTVLMKWAIGKEDGR